MPSVTLELSESQALDLIQDLHRAVALLDLSGQESESRLHQHACLTQSLRLVDLAEDLDSLCRGMGAPGPRRRPGR